MRQILLVSALLALALPSWAQAPVRIGVHSLPPAKGNPYQSTDHTSQVVWSSLFDRLTSIDQQGAVVGRLATTWRQETPTRWVFDLREGVRFHNGAPFNAAAVKAAIDYLTSPGAAVESVSREISPISGAEILGPYQIAIDTDAPNGVVPRILAGMAVVEPESWARLGRSGFALQPVGTGAFMLESWEPNRVRLRAFGDAWRRAKVERIDILEIQEPASRVQGMQAGGLDIAIGLAAEDLRQLERFGVRAHKQTATTVFVIALVTTEPGPLQDVRVRKALNYGVNKALILQVIMGGVGKVATQPTPSGANGYDPSIEGYPYDPAKARALLVEAGYAEGLELVLEATAGSSSYSAAMLQAVAADLARIGVSIEIRPIPFSQQVRLVLQGAWQGDMFLMDFQTRPRMDSMRPFRLHGCGGNHPWYCDPSIEPIIAAANAELDTERRVALMRQIMRHYVETASSLFLFEEGGVDAIGPRIAHYETINGRQQHHALRLVGGDG